MTTDTTALILRLSDRALRADREDSDLAALLRLAGGTLAELSEKPTMTEDALTTVLWRLGQYDNDESARVIARAILAELDPPRLPLNRGMIREAVSDSAPALDVGNRPNYLTVGDVDRITDAVMGVVERFDPPVEEWVRTVEELDALPVGSVVLDAEPSVMERSRSNADIWHVAGSDIKYTAVDVELPARVLYRPEVFGE